ncbi:hypothetical protein B9W61_21555 [Streptomyces sp. CS057]|nr:hypothetical protein B9W61_21555 [Streptomyces sp. CS057]
MRGAEREARAARSTRLSTRVERRPGCRNFRRRDSPRGALPGPREDNRAAPGTAPRRAPAPLPGGPRHRSPAGPGPPRPLPPHPARPAPPGTVDRMSAASCAASCAAVTRTRR